MASLKPVIPLVLKLEAGYAVVNGIPTNKGIIWPTFTALSKSILGIEPTDANFRRLTDRQVEKIMHHFWSNVQGDNINNQAVAMYIFDWYWATGNKAISRIQETLNKYFGNNLPGTVVFGKQTLAAVNSTTGATFLKYLHKERYADYSKLSLAKGLLNRLDTLYSTITNEYLNHPLVPGLVSRVMNKIIYG